ncbi:MAG: glycosyltransferase [Clostridiales bacterium]|nr:glycosyltransferase [Clostridiales bacterium]
MIRIVHIITGLGSGGAENMLYKLLKYSDKSKYYHEVISLMDEGVIGKRIRDEGVKIHSMNVSKANIFKSILYARRICKDFDIINTWLYHADLFGFVIAKLLLKKKLIWNIRHSNLDKNANKSRTLMIVKINSLLSKKTDCITFNSNKALETHLTVGFKNKNTIVIPNGFELNKFSFNEENRNTLRRAFNLDKESKALITVGRWDVQKDYVTLFKALNEIKNTHTNFKMIMVGTNLDEYNEELCNLSIKYDLRDKLMLLGRRNDISEILSAADCYISSSLGESFSNSIGEAMACALPCIVTDVGDSKQIVGKTNYVVNAKDFKGLAEAIGRFLDKFESPRNFNSRNRIVENFDINKVVKDYERNYQVIHFMSDGGL